MAPRATPVRDLLLRDLERAFDRRSWHGPNLRNSVRGVDAAMASWRPQPERHNIWELVVHAAYWKYRVWRLLSAEKRSFGIRGSDWFARPEPGLTAGEAKRRWKAEVALLEAWHRTLLEAVGAFPEPKLTESRGEWTYEELIAGAAAHDLYHAGQIRLLRRMRETAGTG